MDRIHPEGLEIQTLARAGFNFGGVRARQHIHINDMIDGEWIRLIGRLELIVVGQADIIRFGTRFPRHRDANDLQFRPCIFQEVQFESGELLVVVSGWFF